jgi:hypothetical protein
MIGNQVLSSSLVSAFDGLIVPDITEDERKLLQITIKESVSLLQEFAKDADFVLKMKMIFGEIVEISQLQQDWARGNIFLPSIQILSSDILGDARGAYALSNNTIYLSDHFLLTASKDATKAVILEEFGHYVDSQLNQADTQGDEGELFSTLVRGVVLSDGELQRIKTEDDSAVITIDGKTVQIEQSNDAYEPNDTLQTAKDFGTITSTQQWDNLVITKTDLDWFKFQLTKPGSSNTSLSVVSQASGLKTTIELYDSQGNFLEAPYYNSSISLANKPAGVYYVKAIANSGDFYYFYYDQGTYGLKIDGIPANNSPLAVDDSQSTSSNTPVTINVLGNDSDPDADSLSLTSFNSSSVQGGTITRDERGTPTNLADDRLIYTPKIGFIGTDTFNYTISDGAATDVGTVTITITKPIYVNANATGLNDGSSWANAYTNLQNAIANTQAGNEIWVAAATYKPTTGSDRNATFNLKNNVSIYGGFIGNETSRDQRNWERNLTTLSGDVGVSGSNLDNSYHVVIL